MPAVVRQAHHGVGDCSTCTPLLRPEPVEGADATLWLDRLTTRVSRVAMHPRSLGRRPTNQQTAMAKHKSDFLNTLDERGFIHQCSDFAGLDALAARGEAVGYIGFDCTAPSFHIGNMIVLMMLRWLQKTGNKPIVLMGGGTTRVGDPSGKDETRKILSIEQIEANKASMQKAAAKLMTFGSGRTDAIMLDNAEWLTKLNYIEMLRDVGRHFSVNRMLTMDSVKTRLERDQEMSFIEFNYQVLQAYDFTVLARNRTATCRWAPPTSGATSSPASI